ncbi:MAG: hypothetical protein Q7R41_00815, partial [Phycisphaerales bacterium]|nr:hypothetical protein [Phycisphaerales bacterium]
MSTGQSVKDRILARLLIVAILACVCPRTSWAGDEKAGLAERFQAHVNYLASDEREGRGVGSKGIEQAAEYIAAKFKEAGLEPAGDGGTYFQTFP